MLVFLTKKQHTTTLTSQYRYWVYYSYRGGNSVTLTTGTTPKVTQDDTETKHGDATTIMPSTAVNVIAFVALFYLVATDGFATRSWRIRFGSSSSSGSSSSLAAPATDATLATPFLVRQAMKSSSSSLGMVRTYATAAELLAAAMSDNEEDEEDEPSEPAAAPAIIEDGGGSATGMSPLKAGIQFPTTLNGSDVRVGIIMARWNGDVVQGLYKGINESLALCGVKPTNVFATYVPGAYELPITAKFLAASKRFDVLVCVGCLIKVNDALSLPAPRRPPSPSPPPCPLSRARATRCTLSTSQMPPRTVS